MNKANLGLADFTIASKDARRPSTVDNRIEVPVEALIRETDREQVAEASQAAVGASTMPRMQSPAERRSEPRSAIAQEDGRYSIKNLKRPKQRVVKFFVNVALDQATKARLKRAADETNLKMAAVMKAYIEKNGY